MQLTFSGAPDVRAPRAKVWSQLMDLGFVARSAPGIESVEQIDPTHFKVISAFGVSAIKVRFALDVELFDMQPPGHARLRARGKAPGSEVDVTSTIDLDQLSPTTTRMRWTAECEVGGVVASIGAHLLDGVAKRLTEQFWADFAQRVGTAPA